MSRLCWFVGLTLLALAACGGKVERDDGSGGNGEGSGNRSGFEETELGPCVRGRPATAGEPCPWLADELCYPTKLAACACICPPGVRSVCITEFQAVSCL